jgi:hypothetical protein
LHGRAIASGVSPQTEKYIYFLERKSKLLRLSNELDALDDLLGIFPKSAGCGFLRLLD